MYTSGNGRRLSLAEDDGEDDADYKDYAHDDYMSDGAGDLVEEDAEFSTLQPRKRSRKGQERDKDAIYGIFNPAYGQGADQSEKPPAAKQKQPLQPIMFVSSSSAPLTSEQISGRQNAPSASSSTTPAPSASTSATSSSAANTAIGEKSEEAARESEFRKLVLGSDAPVPVSSTVKSLKPQKKDVKDSKVQLDPAKRDAFSKYGKNGFALKFMQKFNFTGRLGKHQSGISEPLAVKARPDRLGLGGGGFKEATSLAQNKRIHREQFGESEEASRQRKMREKEEEDDAEIAALWKKVKENRSKLGSSTTKGKSKKNSSRFRTAAEIMADQQSSVKAQSKEKRTTSAPQAGGYVILDMRGTSSKMRHAENGLDDDDDAASVGSSSSKSSHGSASSSGSSSSSSSSSSNMSQQSDSLAELKLLPALNESVGKEISYNLKSLVEASQERITKETIHIQRLEATIQDKQGSLAKLQENEDRIKAASLQAQAALDCITEAFESIEQIGQDWLGGSRACLKALGDYWGAYQPEQPYGFHEDAAALQLANQLLGAWANADTQGENNEIEGRYSCDAEEPEWSLRLGKLKEMLDQWLEFLREKVRLSEPVIRDLLESNILLTIEQEIYRAWQSVDAAKEESSEAALAARLGADAFARASVDVVRGLVSESDFQKFTDRVILPELQYRVDRWHASSKSLGKRLDLWIVPWVDIMRKSIRSKLHRPIRQVLSKALRRKCKTPEDIGSWGVELAMPWRDILSESTFERLLAEGLVPCLIKLIQDMTISRTVTSSDRRVIKAMAVLAPCFPSTSPHIRAVLLGEFFPRWLHFLYEWIAATPDVRDHLKNSNTGWRDVATWFQDWRLLLDSVLPRQDKQLQAPMGRALGLIAYVSGKGPGKQGLFKAAHRRVESLEKTSYDLVLEKLEKDQLSSKQHSSIGKHSRHDNKEMQQGKAKTIRAEEMSARDFLEKISTAWLHTTFMRHPKFPISDEGLPVYLLGNTSLVFDKDIVRVASDNDTSHIQNQSLRFHHITLEQLVEQVRKELMKTD